MQRRITFGLLFGLSFLALAGCGKDEPNKPVALAVDQPNGPKPGEAGPGRKAENLMSEVTPQDRCDAAVANAFRFLAEKKEVEALAAFEEAHAAVASDFIKGEIERLKSKKKRHETAERTAQDIKTVLEGGRAIDAAKLAVAALEQFGDSDAAESLTNLKRQADALVSTELPDNDRKRRFLDEAKTSLEARNFRAALLSYDQAAASGADVAVVKPTYDDIRNRLSKYDEQRNHAAELRRDSSKIEDAIACLEEARKAWETPQVTQEIEELKIAMNNRRDRLAVADFEVIGDVGIPLAGRTIAEEILPHFTSRYDLVERSQVGAILQDINVNPAELHNNEKGRTEFARLAKARYFVVGSVSKLYGVAVNARLVDAQSGLVVQTAKVVAATPEELSSKLPLLARILQMTDDQKIAHEQELAKATTIAVAEPPAALPAPPPAQAAPDPAVQPIVASTPRPPEIGQVAVEDFVIPAPAAQPQAVVIVDSPWRNRAFFVSVDLGDNLLRRGLYREALRHYEFAVNLNPGSADVRLRIDRCRPFLPAPLVVISAPRPRLAVLPFVEIGQPGFVPYGLGGWTADHIAPYFYPTYDLVDRGETYWWMGRLGLSVRDVLRDPSARLLLARAMGVRYFLMGNLRETGSFDATAQLIDAEFNALVSSGNIHVRSPRELKYRLAELAQVTLMPPEQRVVYVQQTVVVRQRIETAQIEYRKGNFKISIGFYREVLVAQPYSVEAQYALLEAERRQRQWEMEEARRLAYEREMARVRQEQEMQYALAMQAQQQASVTIVIDIDIFGRRKQRASEQLLVQARSSSQSGNFAMSIGFYESAAAMDRSPQVQNELAIARAQGAEAERRRMEQAQAIREAQLRQQYQSQLQASKAALTDDANRRVEAERGRRLAEEANAKAGYDRLLDQAQQAKAKQQYDVAVSSLQTARTLRPSPEIDQMVNAALDDQARAQADKKGAAERQKLDAQLVAERERSQKIEAESAQNQLRHDEAIRAATTAMAARNFEQGKQQFELAAQAKRTQEAIDGIRRANDEIAKGLLANEAARKAQEEQRKKEAEHIALIAEAKQSAATKQFDPAIQKLQAAISLKPSSVEAQAELVKIRQAREDHLSANRKQPVVPVKQDEFQQLLEAGKAKIAAKQYDAAIVSLNDALKIKPNDPSAVAALQQAQQLQAVPKENPKAVALAQALARARAAIKANQFDEAVQGIAQAGQLDPSNPELKKVQQELSDARATHAAAEDLRVEQARRKLFTGHLEAARKALAEKQFDVAGKSLGEATKLYPADPTLAPLQQQIADGRKAPTPPTTDMAKQTAYLQAMKAGVEAYNSKKYPEAVVQFAEALKNKPGDPTAEKYLQTGKAAVANDDMIAKRKLAYDDAMTTAQTAFAANRFDDAIKAAQIALQQIPNDPAATQLLDRAEKSKAAVNTPKKDPLKVDPPKKDPLKVDPPKKDLPKSDPRQEAHDKYLAAARDFFAKKKYEDAILYATEALKYVPNDPEATKIVNESRAALTPPKKDVPKVDPPKKDPPKVDPVKLAYDQNIGGARAAFSGKRFDEALRLAMEALRLVPSDPEATNIINASRAALAPPPKKDPPKVDPPKKDAPKVDPNKEAHDKYLAAARDYFAKKQYDEAMRYAAEALKYVPNEPEATNIVNASRAALTPPPKKDPPKVEPPKVDPVKQAHDQYMTAARAAFTGKRFDEALRFATEALKLIPGDAEATNIVNASRAALTPPPKKDPPKVEPPKKDPPKADPQAQINQHVQTAAVLEAQGKYGEAQAHYQEALKLAPTNAELKKKVDFCKAMADSIADLNAGKFAEATIGFDLALRLYPADANAKHYLGLAKAKKK